MRYTVLTKPVDLVRIHNGGRKHGGWRQQEPKRTGSVFLSCGGRDQDSESSAPAPGAVSDRRRPLTVPGGCALTVVPRFRKKESPPSRASAALLLPNSARAPRRQGRRLLIWAAPMGPSMVVYTEIPTGLQLPSNHSTSVVTMKR